MADLKTINYPVTPLYLDAQTMAKSLSVTIASDQTPIPVTGSFSISNPSVGPNNTTLPTSSNLIGGNDTGTLRPLDVTMSGGVAYLKVDASAFLNASAATSTNQVTGNASLASIDGKLPALTSNGYLASEVMQIDGINDSTNSSTTILGANATFTGTWKDITNYNSFSVGVYADQDSLTNGLQIQFSHNASDIDHIHYYTYLASTNGVGYNLTSEFKYYRIVYTNGAVAQTRFALSSILRPTALFPSMYKLTNTLNDNSQAIVTRSVITGVTTGGGGGYVNVKVNPSGSLVADVSGTVAATQSGTWNINNISGTVSLPTGAAISSKQPALGTAGTASSDVITVQGIAGMTALTVSQSTAANLNATVVNSGTFAVQATQSGTWNINNISGTISLPTLAATSTIQSDGSQKTQIVDGSGNVIASTTNALNVNVQNTSIQAKSPVNLNGSGSGAAATVSSVITLTAPSNAVGFVLMNMDTSSANIRYGIGRTASATLGQQLQPGRDTGFIPCGANVSLCAESGTQTYDIQWVSQ